MKTMTKLLPSITAILSGLSLPIKTNSMVMIIVSKISPTNYYQHRYKIKWAIHTSRVLRIKSLKCICEFIGMYWYKFESNDKLFS